MVWERNQFVAWKGCLRSYSEIKCFTVLGNYAWRADEVVCGEGLSNHPLLSYFSLVLILKILSVHILLSTLSVRYSVLIIYGRISVSLFWYFDEFERVHLPSKEESAAFDSHWVSCGFKYISLGSSLAAIYFSDCHWFPRILLFIRSDKNTPLWCFLNNFLRPVLTIFILPSDECSVVTYCTSPLMALFWSASLIPWHYSK
jgi:hypothetical protein